MGCCCVRPRSPANARAARALALRARPARAGYAVDIAIPGSRVALEADGPTHLARCAPGTRQLGPTAMKARHLRLLGWRVLNVTYLQWNSLEGDAARQRWLAARLREAQGPGAAGPGGAQ